MNYRAGSTTKTMMSGASVDILAPAAEDIRFSDISDTLKRIVRHGSQGIQPVTVADHIIFGMILAEPFQDRIMKLWILHDMHEYITGDNVTPLKRAAAAIAGMDVFRVIENAIDRVLYQIADVAPPSETEKEIIKSIDARTCAFEDQYLANIGYDDFEKGYGDEIAKHYGIPTGIGAHFTLDRDGFNSEFDNIVSLFLPKLFNWEGGK